VPAVDDLRLVSIEAVDPATEALPPSIAGWKSEDIYLRLSFFSVRNVRNLAADFNLRLFVDAYFCGNQGHQFAMSEYLFDRDGMFTDSVVPSRSRESSPMWVYLPTKLGPAKDPYGELTIPAYDLAMQPRDICVQLRGSSMWRDGFSSNVAKATAAELTSALGGLSRPVDANPRRP
jgi:hypothetical protein